MAVAQVNTDISNYTINDILSIFNIVDPTVFNVTDVANSLIAKMKIDGKPEMMTFFAQARDKVLGYLQNLGKEPLEGEQTESIEEVWASDKTFQDKNPNNPALYFDDGSHITVEQRAIRQTMSSEPIFARHLLVIDSQYRSSILPYSTNPQSNAFNTSFSFNLTSQITKATSITLYSYSIPTSWNAFSALSGNTFFIYNGVIIIIPDGNYTPQTIADAINSVAQQSISTAGLVVKYNRSANRITFTNTDPLLDTVTAMFFIQSNTVNFTNCGSFVLSNFQTLSINSTLGWLLGFRTTPNLTTGNVELFLAPNIETFAEVAPQTYGPTYFTLSVEDYSNQRLTGGLYNITNTKRLANLTVQDYYNNVNVACKLREGSLTQAQIYAINALIDNNKSTTAFGFNNTLSGPTSSSTLAVIPLENINAIRPEPYIKFGGDLVMNTRNYSRPTVLDRFIVSLRDDKGNLVNLYDNDWSFSLIVEERLN
jgi:hypothetical protein